MIERYERRLGTGGLADGFEQADSQLAALRGQIDGLRQIAFGCLLLSAAVLAFLIYQSLVTTKDLAVLTQDGGVIAGKLDGVSSRVTNIEALVVGMVALRARSAAPPEVAAAPPPAPRDWTGIYVSDLAPLLPYLAEPGEGTGELWIYSDNEAFVDRVAAALQALVEQGMDGDIEGGQ